MFKKERNWAVSGIVKADFIYFRELIFRETPELLAPDSGSEAPVKEIRGRNRT